MASPLMKARFLGSSEAELKRVRRYAVNASGMAVWEDSYAQIQASITRIREFPECGHIVDELSEFTANRFREMHCGKNRIIYEVRDDTIYVHLIIDQRRDLTALLQKIIHQV